MKRFLIFIATALFAILANTALAGIELHSHHQGGSCGVRAFLFLNRAASFYKQITTWLT